MMSDSSKMDIIDGKINYILPLDAIDLNHITQTNVVTDTTKPVWSTNNFLSKNFYELNFMCEKKKESNPKASRNKGNETNMIYHCNICNIKVPTIFKKEHNSSPKHRICSQIISMALDRANKSISTVDNDYCVLNKTKYHFCEACAVIVTGDIDNHNMTKEHFISLIHDKYLNELLMICNNKDYLNEVDFQYLTNLNAKTTNDNPNEDNITNDMSEYNSDDDSDNFIIDYDESEIKKVNVKTVNLNDYIKIVNKEIRNDLTGNYKLEVEDDNVLINTVDKCVLKVSVNNFHGFDWFSGVLICRTCGGPIEDMEAHKMNVEHIRRLAIPLENKHCIREVDTISKYCIVCHANLISCGNHESLPEHCLALNKAMVTANKISNCTSNAIRIQVENKDSVFCKPCRRYIHRNDFDSHSKGKAHKLCENNQSYVRKESSTKAKVSIQKVGPQTYCSLNSGLNSSKETDHEILNNGNGLVKKAEENKNTLNSTELSISLFNNACINVSEFPEAISNFTVLFDSILCQICNVKVPKTDRNFTEHVNGKSHKNNINKIKTETHIKNEPENVKETEHKNDYEQNKVSNVEPRIVNQESNTMNNNNIMEANTDTEVQTPGDNMSSSFSTLNSGKIFCEACRLCVLTPNLDSHLEGEYHKKNEKILNFFQKHSKDEMTHSFKVKSVLYEIKICGHKIKKLLRQNRLTVMLDNHSVRQVDSGGVIDVLFGIMSEVVSLMETQEKEDIDGKKRETFRNGEYRNTYYYLHIKAVHTIWKLLKNHLLQIWDGEDGDLMKVFSLCFEIIEKIGKSSRIALDLMNADEKRTVLEKCYTVEEVVSVLLRDLYH